MNVTYAFAALLSVGLTATTLFDYGVARSSLRNETVLSESNGPSPGGRDTALFAESSGPSPGGRDTAMA